MMIPCLMGPTASGKTDLAIELSKHFPVEIISVDSVMIYRGLDIGSAKPDPDTLKQAPHHLVNLCDVTEPYSAGDFVRDATTLIQDIQSRGKIPLLVGGTMMYFRALQFGLADLPESNPNIRERLEQELAQFGAPHLHEKLKICDPATAVRLHPNDKQRIMRALEVFDISGEPLSKFHEDNPPTSFQFVNWILAPSDRSVLHDRIAQRFKMMLKAGLINEVRQFYEREDCHGDLPAMRSVGYRQVWDYLDGNIPEAELCDRSIFATRQLAKRQLTWLKSWPNATWFHSLDEDVVEKIIESAKNL